MYFHRVALTLACILLLGVVLPAQEAKIPVKVSPSEAYVFLDGVAIRDGNVTLKTTPGEHTISVYNYGYVGQVRTVTAQAGKNERQTFTLQPSGAEVSSPYGYIQIEGPGRAAVLLNGTTPDYHVGHVDMFNNHIIWKQQLVVPVGTHQLLVTRNGHTVYSAPVEVAAGQRVIIYIAKGKTKTQTVDNGTGVARPRFKAGTASATVVVAPVSGSFAANPGKIDCNESAQLSYSSVETLHSYIKNGSEVKEVKGPAGEHPVSPHQTTTYAYEASGPGGVVKHDATINVNPTITSTLELSKPEVDYLKIGDKVVTQETSDLKYDVHNADNISIDPIGKVDAKAPGTTTGERKLTPEPKPVTGPLDEKQEYKMTSTNVCGGSDTHTVHLRIKGMMEPYILSAFFPTGYPTKDKADVGLVASQQEPLLKMAKAFLIYSEHVPEAKLVVRGYTDERGADAYNMKLSERRVNAVKSLLVAHGVPADKIDVEPNGKTKQLDQAAVAQLEAQNPNKAGAADHDERAVWLTYNRRIDIELQPVGVVTA